MKTSRPVLFSGMQPTGQGLMLGNYLGALKNWVHLQKDHDCIFCVVNLHAVTMKQEPKVLRETSYRVLASYMAAGIDPAQSLIFWQSHVPEHAELGWLLTCHTYMGELSRMTQFKDKSGKASANEEKSVPVGLFTYPSLMAADILLYQTTLVPVGSDQKQHMELARDLAQRMNNTYGPLFKVPEIFIPPLGARIMSLADPLAKMSKSSDDPMATVFMMDSDELILKKFKRAVTDSLNSISYSDEQPGVKNLITIQSAISGQSPAQVLSSLEGKQYGALKQQTADMVIELLGPMRSEVGRLMADTSYLDEILRESAGRAGVRARATLDKVKIAMGLT